MEVALREIRKGASWAAEWTEKGRYMGQDASFDDRFAIHDGVYNQACWWTHYQRVIKQHRDAGWDVTAHQQWLEVWRSNLTDLMLVCRDIWGLSHAGKVPVDPQPREQRVPRPGQATESQKAGRAVLVGLWALVLGFVALLSATDSASAIGSPYGTGLAKSAAILFAVIMTIYIEWAGRFERTHPRFRQARVVMGTAGAALLAAKAAGAVRGAHDRVHGAGDRGPH